MLHGLLWDRRNMLKLLGIGTASVSLLPPFESRGQETAPRYDLTATSNCLSAAFRIGGWTLTTEDRVGIGQSKAWYDGLKESKKKTVMLFAAETDTLYYFGHCATRVACGWGTWKKENSTLKTYLIQKPAG